MLLCLHPRESENRNGLGLAIRDFVGHCFVLAPPCCSRSIILNRVRTKFRWPVRRSSGAVPPRPAPGRGLPSSMLLQFWRRTPTSSSAVSIKGHAQRCQRVVTLSWLRNQLEPSDLIHSSGSTVAACATARRYPESTAALHRTLRAGTGLRPAQPAAMFSSAKCF